MTLEDAMLAVATEVRRQFMKWGRQTHPCAPEGSPDDVAFELGMPTADVAKTACDMAAEEGRLTWAHILVEEVAEAIEAATLDPDSDDVDVELIQVAAVAISWLRCRAERRAATGRAGARDE